MDGLLFDTETLYGEAILTAAAEVGCTMSRDVFVQLIGRSREVNHRFLLEHYGADYPLEALIAAWGRHFRVLAAAGLPLVGADVVEVSPAYDHAELTSVAAAHVGYELLALILLGKA